VITPELSVALPPADPRLPGLRQLLEPTAAAEVLRLSLRLDPDEVRIVAVRYKPRRRLVVQYDLTAGGTMSRAVALLDARKANCVVQLWPSDAALPALGLPIDELAASLGIEPAESVERLGYKPFARAILRIGPHVAKLYASEEKWRRAAEALERLTRAGFGASLERVAPEVHGTVQRFVDGTAPAGSDAAASAGAVLRRLHALPADGLRPVYARDRLAESSRGATLAATIIPDVAARAERLFATLARQLPPDLPAVAAHGDFEPGQLIAGRAGLTPVDVDELCAAPRADDLGRYAAHAVRGAEGDIDAVQEVLGSLLAGYGLRPDGLEWYVAAAILARAAAPFRHQEPDWPARVEALLVVAEHVASEL
jgi:aminoglycoside phosphotransferase (APT) family kinase protein